jgi:hypothetical protein
MNISKNQFRNFIKEEIRKTLREDYATKLYKIEGLLVTDTYKKTQTQILSDIRSITGITTIDSKEYNVRLPKPGYQYDVLTVKIDPYPYTKKGGKFDINTINQIIDNIKGIRGVIRFKVDNPQLINIGI